MPRQSQTPSSLFSRLMQILGLQSRPPALPLPQQETEQEDELSSDYIHFSFDAMFEEQDVTCRLGYCYTPDCELDFSIETENDERLFSFETNAYSLQKAFAQLGKALTVQRINLPMIGLHPAARWASDSRTCDQVSIPGQGPTHPCIFIKP